MQSLQDKDKRYIWHPYTSLLSPVVPIPVAKGEGVYLVDEAGNRYIDAVSSWWVTIHGHAHPYIARKLYEQAMQLEQVIFTQFTHRPAVELAERLISLLPAGFSKVFYSDNGSTAVEVGVKMALQYWWNKQPSPEQPPQRNKIIAFNKSYHGDTFGTMSLSDRSVFTLAFRDKLFEVIFIDVPDAENTQAVQQTMIDQSAQVAAFIYEPLLQGAGGMNVYQADLLDQLLVTCREHDIICIADEVMTGFGRTGSLFASEQVPTKPDIICLSKGLTGGTMALGVTACTEKITAAFQTTDRLKTFFHGHSFTANPLACAASLASLDLFTTEQTLEKVQRIANQHLSFAQKIKKHPAVKNIRTIGTILAFEYNSESNNYLNNIGQHITAFMLERNIYLRPLGNTVYIMPPYCITEEELERVYGAVEEYLEP
ncbi:MAG: adenosylmethionine--8-amino-7-oxononanoate transaminase [Williamsia sp.]|nr:adenosylmethionine--8-amino-7-oxononanoate transaminase [Williamsia sp.]